MAIAIGLVALPTATVLECSWKAGVPGKRVLLFSSSSSSITRKVPRGFQVRAFFPNPTNAANEPILKEALKEPVAFVGGIFAGLLRLDLNEEPLKEWVSRTVEAAGITAEEISNNNKDVGEDEEMPQQIEIE